MKIHFATSLIICLLLLACTAEQAQEPLVEGPGKASKTADSSLYISTDGQGASLSLSSREGELKAAPDWGAKSLRSYHKGSSFRYLGRMSKAESLIRLEGVDHREPWLEVEAADGYKGWLFGGCLSFDSLPSEDLQRLWLDRRLYFFFGDELAAEVKQYQREAAEIRSLPAFRMMYKKGENLEMALEERVNEALALSSADSLANFFWLQHVLPGYLVYLPAPKIEYQLYRDYRYWGKLAGQTADSLDDQLVELFYAAYPLDSLGYSVGSWSIALLEENREYSLLGRGQHLALFERLDALYQSDLNLEEALDPFKQKLLDDIFLTEHYWLSREEVLAELRAILAADFSCLQKSEKVELSARKAMLAQGQAEFGGLEKLE